MQHSSPPLSRRGRSRKVHGEAIWDLARAAYLRGLGAPEVCRRYGLNLSTFRDRARREGWRRADVFDDAPPWTAMDEAGLELDPDAMAASAWLNAARAIARNRRMEARSWVLIARDLDKQIDSPGALLAEIRRLQASPDRPASLAAQRTEPSPPPMPRRPDRLDGSPKDPDSSAPESESETSVLSIACTRLSDFPDSDARKSESPPAHSAPEPREPTPEPPNSVPFGPPDLRVFHDPISGEDRYRPEYLDALRARSGRLSPRESAILRRANSADFRVVR